MTLSRRYGVATLRAALASWGTVFAIPRRAVLGAPYVAGQGLRPDRLLAAVPDAQLVARLVVRYVNAGQACAALPSQSS